MLNPLACSPSETGGVARRLPDCGRSDYIRRRAWSRNEEIDRDGPGMPVVRAPVPGSPRRFPQRFCCGAHRMAFWSALRRWAERAVAAGVLSLDQIREGAPEACMLLPGEEAPAPALPALGHPVGQSAPVAPPERLSEAGEDPASTRRQRLNISGR